MGETVGTAQIVVSLAGVAEATSELQAFRDNASKSVGSKTMLGSVSEQAKEAKKELIQVKKYSAEWVENQKRKFEESRKAVATHYEVNRKLHEKMRHTTKKPIVPKFDVRSDALERVEERLIDLKFKAREKIIFTFAAKVQEDPKLKEMLAAKQKAGASDSEIESWMQSVVKPNAPQISGPQSFKLDKSGMKDLQSKLPGGLGKGGMSGMLKTAVPMAIAGGMAAELVSAGKASIQLQSGLAQIAQRADLSKSQIAEMRRELLEVAPKYAKSAEGSVAPLQDLIDAGAPMENSIAILEVAMKSAATNGHETQGSVDLLRTAVDGLGESWNNSGGIMDTAQIVMKRGQIDAAELENGIAKMGSVVKDAGGSFLETASAIGTLAKQGKTTREAGSGINQIYMAVAKNQHIAAKMGGDVADAFSAQALESKGLHGFLQDLHTATGGSTEKMYKLLQSNEAVSAALGLTGKNAQMAMEDLEAAAIGTGSLDKGFKKIQETDPAFQIAQMKESIHALFVNLTGELAPGLGMITRFVTGFINAIKTGTQTLGDVSGAWMNVLNNVFQLIQRVAKQIGGFAKVWHYFTSGQFGKAKEEFDKVKTSLGETKDHAIGVVQSTKLVGQAFMGTGEFAKKSTVSLYEQQKALEKTKEESKAAAEAANQKAEADKRAAEAARKRAEAEIAALNKLKEAYRASQIKTADDVLKEVIESSHRATETQIDNEERRRLASAQSTREIEQIKTDAANARAENDRQLATDLAEWEYDTKMRALERTYLAERAQLEKTYEDKARLIEATKILDEQFALDQENLARQTNQKLADIEAEDSGSEQGSSPLQKRIVDLNTYIEESAQRAQASLIDLFTTNYGDDTGKLQEMVEKLNELKEGKISPEELNAWTKMQNSAADYSNQLKDIKNNALSSLDSSFEGLITSAMRFDGTWKSALDSFRDTALSVISQVAAKMAILGVVKAIGGSATGGLFSALLGMADGGVTRGFRLGPPAEIVAAADGLIVDRPRFALVGEGGENEYVVPERKLVRLVQAVIGMSGGGGGKGDTYVTNVQTPFPSSRDTIAKTFDTDINRSHESQRSTK